jgi:hypothetical protein
LRIHALVGVASLVLLLAACDDPNAGLFDPVIQEDTVDLAVPMADPEVPTALDIAYAKSPVRTRFPELVGDAEAWDLTIRRENEQLVFVPAAVFGFRNPVGGDSSSAAVTLPLERAIDEVIEAPGRSALRRDTTVVIRTDRIYVVRSRRTDASFAGCENYAKVQPLSVDVAGGFVRLRVVGNARCNDPRLAEDG